MDNKLIIIGAGVAGLSAGCYARMNGYQTTIFEMAANPGGLCTSWKRKGYLFDGSAAGLAGSAPGNSLYRLWQELGVAGHCDLHYGENFGTIVFHDGQRITVYTNIDLLESHLVENFPQETKIIQEFSKGIRSFLDLDIPFNTGRGWDSIKQSSLTLLNSLKHTPAIMKYGSLTIRDFAAKVNDPKLKSVFHNLVHFGGPDVPILTVMLPLAYAHRKMAGIPIKGWLAFARSIEDRFLELGGGIHYKSKVQGLILENQSVRGVILANGDRITSDRVLSAVDGRFTEIMLLGKDENEINKSYLPEKISDQPVQVNLGVAMEFLKENGPITYLLREPQNSAGQDHSRITVHIKHYDRDAAPKGKSATTTFLDSGYSGGRRSPRTQPGIRMKRNAAQIWWSVSLRRTIPGSAPASRLSMYRPH
jgi:phytoene dehydrogenase-like protein